MVHWKFWLFLAITLIRPLPQFYLEWRNRHNKKIDSSAHVSTVILYASYLVIWLFTLYYLYGIHNQTLLFVCGLLVLVTGMTLRFAGLYALDQFYSSNVIIFQSHQLIHHGIYAIIRHPLHAALLMELAGMIIVSGHIWLTVVWGVLYFTVKHRNRHEDRLMRLVFNQIASDYQRSIPGMNLFKGASILLKKVK